MSKKKKKKNERRSFDFNDGNIEIARWNDNSIITIGSNAYGVQLIGSAKRSENRKKGKTKRKSDNTITFLLQHVSYSLSKNVS